MSLFQVGIGSYVSPRKKDCGYECVDCGKQKQIATTTMGGIFTFGEETKVEVKDLVTWKYVFGMGLGLGLAFGYNMRGRR